MNKGMVEVAAEAGDEGLSIRNGSTALVADPQAAVSRYLHAATADNTRRAYQGAIRHFLAWGGRLPCDEAMVLHYLADHAETLNPRTLGVRLAALSQWHQIQGFANPVRTPQVSKMLKGVARVHGRPARKAVALPVEDLVRLAARLDARGDLRSVRDSALLQVGFYGAFRRNELCALEVSWLEWVPRGVRILLPRSKTDTEGRGVVKAIPAAKAGPCPVQALRRWLEASGIEEGPVFRRVGRWGTVGAAALAAGSLNEILVERAREAELGYAEQLSGHSLRRGLATSAYRAGADFKAIKRQGGWRFAGTVQGYIDEAGEFDVNAAGVLLGS